MNESPVLAVSLQSMQADMARVQQISMNMANALTPGYQRGVAVQAAAPAGFGRAMEAARGEVPAGLPAPGAPASGAAVDFHLDARAGTLRRTGQSLDVALRGAGYFEVMTEHGPAYTRQGSFQLDARGRLVTAQGHPVMGQGGEILLPTDRPEIAANGEITNPAAPEAGPVATLKLVRFEAGTRMQRLGDGLLGAPEGAPPLADAPPQADAPAEVSQGYLENSNVNSAREMTQLMQAMRHFESMSRIAQMHDEMLGTAIRKLGDVA
jgi:flagellar basal-body rod protein FlgG